MGFLIGVQPAASGTMRTLTGAGALEALSSVAGAFAFGAVTGGVTDITLGFCFGHNFLLALRAALL